GTGGVDPHVGQVIADGVFAGAEEPQKLLAPELEGGGEKERRDNQAGEAGTEDPLGLVVVAPAHGDGGAGCAALTQKSGKGGEQIDHREAESHAGEGDVAHYGHVADVNAVYDVVEQIDQLRQNGG